MLVPPLPNQYEIQSGQSQERADGGLQFGMLDRLVGFQIGFPRAFEKNQSENQSGNNCERRVWAASEELGVNNHIPCVKC